MNECCSSSRAREPRSTRAMESSRNERPRGNLLVLFIYSFAYFFCLRLICIYFIQTTVRISIINVWVFEIIESHVWVWCRAHQHHRGGKGSESSRCGSDAGLMRVWLRVLCRSDAGLMRVWCGSFIPSGPTGPTRAYKVFCGSNTQNHPDSRSLSLSHVVCSGGGGGGRLPRGVKVKFNTERERGGGADWKSHRCNGLKFKSAAHLEASSVPVRVRVRVHKEDAVVSQDGQPAMVPTQPVQPVRRSSTRQHTVSPPCETWDSCVGWSEWSIICVFALILIVDYNNYNIIIIS